MNLDAMLNGDSLGGDLWRTAKIALETVEDAITTAERLQSDLRILRARRDMLKTVIGCIEQRWVDELAVQPDEQTEP